MNTLDIVNVVTPQSEVTIFENVPISDYKNQILWDSKQDRESYFANRPHKTFTNFRYVREKQALTLPINKDEILLYNYCRFRNNLYSDFYFYAFINSLEYVSDECTRVVFEIDAWQTFQFNVQYRRTFVERAMTGEYYGGSTPTYVTGIDKHYYPEPIESGDISQVTHTEANIFKEYYTLICSSADLTVDPGTKNNPNLNGAPGSLFDECPSALTYYLTDESGSSGASNFYNFIGNMTEYPWITQCIQSVTIIPKEIFGQEVTKASTLVDTPGGKLLKLSNGVTTLNTPNFWVIKDYYKHFKKELYKRSKMLMYPYSYIEMTTWNGQNVTIRPQNISGTSLQIGAVTFLGANPRIAFYISGYNSDGYEGDIDVGEVRSGDFLDNALIIGNFPQLPVAVDNYILYQAQHANTFKLNNEIQNYNKKEANVLGAIEGGYGAITSALSGNIGGVISSVYSGAKSAYMGNKNAEINIQKQLAQIADKQITPPTISAQQGGDAFNFANGLQGVTLKWRTMLPEFQETVYEYFFKYGYAINKSNAMLSDYIRGNSIFNYVKTQGCYLQGSIPDVHLEIIKQMFDNGVTLWHEPDLIGQAVTNTRADGTYS